MNKYINVSPQKVKKISRTEIKKDAEKLKTLLEQILPHVNQDKKGFVKEVIKDINFYILDLRPNGLRSRLIRNFKEDIYNDVLSHQNKSRLCIERGDEEKAKLQMKEWSQALHQFAVKNNENIESKQAHDIDISGHSLGGSKAQVCLVRQLIHAERIPLPGKRCSGYFFDDPKINREDNKKFKQFGESHSQLLNALNVKFKIFRMQEAYDIIPLAGEEHLGATFSPKERESLSKWVEFEAAVNKIRKGSRTTGIVDSSMAHESRFLFGDHYRTFHPKLPFKLPNKPLPNKKDYVKTYYDSFIQGIFDRRGRNTSLGNKGKKVFKGLLKRLWHIPPFYEMFLTEKNRKSHHPIFMLVRKILFNRTKSSNLPEFHFLDANHNFAVHHHGGVISSTPRRGSLTDAERR